MKLRENMPRYVHQLFGNDRNMLLLVIHCIYLLDLGLGDHSLVFDAATQEAEKNKYCSAIGECAPGTHVMCMYGDTKVMGPRCADGRPIPLEAVEKELFLDIFNGFRRDLALGKDVRGKDDVRIPKAKNMTKLNWDETLATFAQAWANQCDGRRAQCQSMEDYPTPGQLVGLFRFDYPDWTHRGSVFEKNVSALTPEKREFVIRDVTKRIYEARKQVTLSAIEKAVGSGNGNVFLTAVYGASSRLGCAFSTFVDYLRSYDTEPFIYNTVLVVCNFSGRPQSGEKVFTIETEEPGSGCCPEGFKEDNCLCEPITKDKDGVCSPDDPTGKHCEKNDQTEEKEQKEEKEEHSSENGDAVMCKPGDLRLGCRPRVVVMPIVTVEDAPSNKLQPRMSQLLDPTAFEQRKQDLRMKIQERVQNVRDKFLKNCVDHDFHEPRRQLSNGGSVNENTPEVTEVQSEYMEPNVNSKETKLEFATNTKPNIDMETKRDFSDLYDLLAAYLSHKRKYKANLQTNAADRGLNDMIRAATPKVYVTSINGEPIKARPVNVKHSPKFDNLIYDVRGFKYQEPPSRKVYISSVNGKPVYYNYTRNLNKLQIPSKRGFKYSVQDIKDKEVPYKSNLDISDDRNRNHRQHSISRTADKEMQSGDMMDQVDVVDFFTDNDRRTREEQTYNGPRRRLHPLHNLAYDTNNIDFNRRLKNDHKYHIPLSMLKKLYYDVEKQYNTDDHLDTDSNEYDRQRNMPYFNDENHHQRNMPYVYDTNEIRQYLNMLNHMRSFKRHDEKSSDHRRLAVDSDPTTDQELEYVVPDRMNLMDSTN